MLFVGVPILISLPLLYWKFNKLQDNILKDKIRYIYNSQHLDSLKLIPNKIIIVGGSNILFGIDKYLLEKELNRPVITLAHVRTDGTENMLRIAEKVFQKGDIALISLEYGGTSKGSSGQIIDYYLSQNKIDLIKYFFQYFLWEKEYVNPNYSKKEEEYRWSIYGSFNNDLFLTKLRNQNFRKQETYENNGIELSYSKKDIEIIENYTQENKLVLIGIHPPLCKQKLSKANIQKINSGNVQTLPIKYITNQNNYLFDTNYIFDYSYHLNQKGREKRTVKLSQDLKQFISSKSNQNHQGSN